MATIIKHSTQKGKGLVNNGSHWIGNDLHQVYDSWSDDKQDAYDRCYQDYLDTPEHSGWGICSANNWQFSVSWFGLYEGENAMFYRTAKNSYIILLDK